MHRYEDYNNSFSSLSSSVGVAPSSVTSWNIRASNRSIDHCKACTCCTRCGKKRLTETRTPAAKINDDIHPEPVQPLSSSILDRSTSKLNSYNHRYNF